jgi:hypothetical protein
LPDQDAVASRARPRDGKQDGRMAMTTPVWREESSRTSQTVYLALGTAVGVMLVYLCRPGTIDGDSNRRAGLLLGLLVLAICGWVFVAAGTQAVVVDPAQRVIRSERRNRFGTKIRVIGFDEIAAVGVQTVAGHHGDTPAWFVNVRLHDGKDVALFIGFFDGQFSRSAMEARRARIESYLQ